MKPPDWSQLSGFDQLAMLVHHPDSEHRFMGLMVVAYADESEHHKEPAIYVVSALLGSGPEWFELGREWRQMLQKKGLESCGFHMSQCESGSEPPYNTMDRDERSALQRTFIDIIKKRKLWGYATGIAQGRYNQPDVKEPAKATLGAFHKPYYFCFSHAIQWMANDMEAGGFPPDECIAFIFDRHQEYQGRAKALYDEILTQHIDNKHRLGHLGFDSRLKAVQLQAADIWAYESQRFLRQRVLGEPKELRWQLTRLLNDDTTNSPFRVRFMSEAGVEELARGRGWIE
jgi:hypothetical protein